MIGQDVQENQEMRSVSTTAKKEDKYSPSFSMRSLSFILADFAVNVLFNFAKVIFTISKMQPMQNETPHKSTMLHLELQGYI